MFTLLDPALIKDTALAVLPSRDPDKVGHKTWDLTLQQGVVASDDGLRRDVQDEPLLHH